ncbi:MAG: hypothetical protein C5B59_15875 [Bacteroidetes bacterium]|nr:MAG: hypothetical protein C5B59_15875 [Bacteroidota bacterium]
MKNDLTVFFFNSVLVPTFLFFILNFFYDDDFPVLFRQVSIIETKNIFVSISGGKMMGMVFKIKSFLQQKFFGCGLCVIFAEDITQDATILFQAQLHVTHDGVLLLFLFIKKSIAAFVVAIALIAPAFE